MSKILLIAMLTASAFDVAVIERGLKNELLTIDGPMGSRGVRVTFNIAAPIVMYQAIKDEPKATQVAVAGAWVSLKAFQTFKNLKKIEEAEELEEALARLAAWEP